MNRKGLAIQEEKFIDYPFISHCLGDLWGTPFPNWFGARTAQRLNKRLVKEKKSILLGILVNFSGWRKWKEMNEHEQEINKTWIGN